MRLHLVSRDAKAYEVRSEAGLEQVQNLVELCHVPRMNVRARHMVLRRPQLGIRLHKSDITHFTMLRSVRLMFAFTRGRAMIVLAADGCDAVLGCRSTNMLPCRV